MHKVLIPGCFSQGIDLKKFIFLKGELMINVSVIHSEIGTSVILLYVGKLNE